MTIDEQIHSCIRNASEISPFEIVKIIQGLTDFPLDRAIKGYFHYKSMYIDELQHMEEHEIALNSPNLALLASLDLRIGNHTTKKKSSSEGLKIDLSDILKSIKNSFTNWVDVRDYYRDQFG